MAASLSKVREQIFESQDAKRIVMKIKTRHLDSQDYLQGIKGILNDILPDWESDQRILLLAIQIYPSRTYLALDINHHGYNFRTAHEDRKPLPVYLLRMASRRTEWDLVRLRGEDDRLCERIADMHESHGYDVDLPLVEDHHSIVVHDNPRSLSAATSL
ncbi:hypothetical protein BJY00DRAFT_112377 [Aspergillus carlsbadensis]|nr:hypothetical protein BJY00DRAFT_112377 [Aspergillus carlsbadensis]